MSAAGELGPADVAAFAASAGLFGYDRRQTRHFLGLVARRFDELEQEVEAARANEAAVADALVAASRTAQEIEERARIRAAAIEQEATARAEALLHTSDSGRSRLMEGLERAAGELRTLIDAVGALGRDTEAPADVTPLHRFERSGG